jgi:hypothetical protein
MGARVVTVSNYSLRTSKQKPFPRRFARLLPFICRFNFVGWLALELLFARKNAPLQYIPSCTAVI